MEYIGGIEGILRNNRKEKLNIFNGHILKFADARLKYDLNRTLTPVSIRIFVS